MKNPISIFGFIALIFFSKLILIGQSNHSHSHKSVKKNNSSSALVFQKTFDLDSLQGYNENEAMQHANVGNVLGLDLESFLSYTKRNFINKKYKLNNFSAKSQGQNPVPQSPCTNIDFETGSATGWTVSGDVTTTSGAAMDPYGNFPKVCPGGSFSLKLGNDINSNNSIAKQTFAVTPTNSYYLLKMAMVILNYPHTVADAAKVYIRFRDASNTIIPCPYFECYYANNSSGVGTSYGLSGFQTGANGVNIGAQSYPTTYIPWTNVGFDLTPYIGTNVTIEIENDWCVYNYDWAYTYIDGECSQLITNVAGGCSSTTGTLTAPSGMTSYSWTGPPTSTVSLSNTQIVNSTVGGIYTVQCTPFSSCGTAVYTFTANLPIGITPLANFTFTTAPCQSTFTVPFSDNSSVNGGPAITNYYWDFDNDGVIDNLTQNPVNTYSAVGSYTTELKVNNGSCMDSITKVITISPGPLANFNVTGGCLNTVTNFTSSSTPTANIASHQWDFGDGTAQGFGTNTSHTYSTPGIKTITYTVTNSSGCTSVLTKTVTIFPKPILNVTSNTVCLGQTTAFLNTSAISAPDNISNWSWDFDNNGTIDNSAQNPTNTFLNAGAFTTELKATSNNGCQDSITVQVKINGLPTATFTPVNACMNSNVLLNNTSNITLPDNITNYSWSFGSGSTPTLTSNIQNPPLLTYNSSGIKSITLMITANTSCTAAITQTVNIYQQPVANFSTTSVCQSTATAYTDLSTTTVGTITGLQWDFTNNSSIDNITNAPTNVFVASGTFTTLLIATSSNGCNDTVALPVNVWGHTIPNFTPDKVCFGAASTFSNLTNETTNANVGTGTTYFWNFADGSTSGIINPNHTYSAGGNANATYSVTLVATSIHNCLDSIIKVVNVYAVPTASFASDSVCLGTASHMTDASFGNGNTVNTYAWDFLSDNSLDIAGVPNPNFTFPAFGNNLVTYTVSTSPVAGLVCTNATNTISVWVNPNPVPDFTFMNKCINAQPNTFNGSLSTIAIGTNTAYVWTYGDGNVSAPSAASASSHTYLAAGIYNVTLTLTSNKGCQAAISKQVTVYEKPYIKIANSLACDQTAMSFTAVSLPNSGTIQNWFWDFNNSITTFEGAGQTTNFTFNGPGAQTVALIGETINGCKDIFSKSIYVNYVPVAIFSGDKLSGCPTPKHCVNFSDASLAVTGPAQISQWQWSLGDGTTLNNQTGTVVNHCYGNSSSNQLALFSVSLVVRTDSGCVSQVNTKTNYITVYPTPIANYTVNPNPGNVLTPLEYFTNQSIDYTKWWWSFGDGPFKTDSVNIDPTHFYSDVSADTYFSNLIVMNQYGCSDTAYVPVEIQPEFTFYIPNAFSPVNNDNINDYFTGKGIGIEHFEMWIFDRWGEKVFYTDDIEKGWDGKVQGKSGDGKQDVYIWKVKLRDVLGKKHEYIGHVTLIK
ncbi:MAG: PKD domain-containing protein [Burkholderiales bacterium]|nr:PKD domain-containing protein [Bacteroidia bacterium]